MSRYRSSRWILILVVLALLAGGGFGALYVIRRGMKQEGLYEQAVRAIREGRPADAERHLRSLLASAPENATARRRLIALLSQEGKIDEAEKETESWLADPKAPMIARRIYCELAFRTWRLDVAEERARALLEEDPEFAYQALLRASEARGTLPDLQRAVQLALSLTRVSDDAPAKVASWLFAAETMFDLLPAIPEEQRVLAEDAARVWLQKASRMLDAAAKDRAFPRETALARIQALSAKPDDRALGEEGLRLALSREAKDHESRAALAKFLIREGRLDEALTVAKELKSAPYTLWREVMLVFAMREHGEQVLALLEDPPIPDDPLVQVIRAKFLLKGDDPDRHAQAVRILLGLRESPAFGVGLAAQSFDILSAAGESDAARQVIEAALATEADPRLEALLLASTALGDPEAAVDATRVAELADQAADFDQSMQVLSILRPAGRAAVGSFLDAQIAKGHDEARHRLLRAAVHVQRAERNEEDVDQAHELAAADLEALRGLEADRGTFGAGARLALLAKRPRVAGALYAMALCREPVVDALPLEMVHGALSTEEAEARGSVAAGLREVAADAGPRAFLEALADGVERGRDGMPDLVAKLESLKKDPANGPLALVALLELRPLGFGPAQPAVELARELCDARPDDVAARVLLGEILRAGHEWKELRGCWEGRPTENAAARDQWVSSLWETGERDQALASARAYQKSRPGDPQAAALLARIYALRGDLEPALSILGAAAPSRTGQALQARILAQRAQARQADPLADAADRSRAWDDAEGAWRSLLLSNPANRTNWDGLMNVLVARGRRDEMINIYTDAITRYGRSESEPVRALARDLLVRRAQIQEQAGRTDAALVDYVALIEQDQPPTLFIPRNNAAWIIQGEYPARIDEAVRYVEEALALKPDDVSVHDTAAMVYLVAGQHDKALEQADIALASASRPGQMRTRALVLEGAGRQEDANAQWQALLDAFPDSPDAVEAHARVSGKKEE